MKIIYVVTYAHTRLRIFTETVEALVQWLNLPAWKVGDRGFEPHSGL